jgi:hypothetical protein
MDKDFNGHFAVRLSAGWIVLPLKLKSLSISSSKSISSLEWLNAFLHSIASIHSLTNIFYSYSYSSV